MLKTSHFLKYGVDKVVIYLQSFTLYRKYFCSGAMKGF